ncbi:MAG: hypothetical protein AW12_00836 [Candidatus Accumulibacter sp. BA-94]|nr:MAG: hypothetical protein AW12_00836 [Candidatus Accumulibacter sp. BA-94]
MRLTLLDQTGTFFRCALIVAWLVSAPWATAETLAGKVVGVTDGDTITVLDAANEQHKIRLAGIDAPERAQPGDQVRYAAAEDAARSRRVGLWADANPVPPWEWRAAKRQSPHGARNAAQPLLPARADIGRL